MWAERFGFHLAARENERGEGRCGESERRVDALEASIQLSQIVGNLGRRLRRNRKRRRYIDRAEARRNIVVCVCRRRGAMASGPTVAAAALGSGEVAVELSTGRSRDCVKGFAAHRVMGDIPHERHWRHGAGGPSHFLRAHEASAREPSIWQIRRKTHRLPVLHGWHAVAVRCSSPLFLFLFTSDSPAGGTGGGNASVAPCCMAWFSRRAACACWALPLLLRASSSLALHARSGPMRPRPFDPFSRSCRSREWRSPVSWTQPVLSIASGDYSSRGAGRWPRSPQSLSFRSRVIAHTGPGFQTSIWPRPWRPLI